MRRWMLPVIIALTLVAWVACTRWHLTMGLPGIHASLVRGNFAITVCPEIFQGSYLDVVKSKYPALQPQWSWNWRKPMLSGYSTTGAAINVNVFWQVQAPVWVASAVLSLPLLYPFARWVIYRRMKIVRPCLHCGYEKHGLASKAPCPECGK